MVEFILFHVTPAGRHGCVTANGSTEAIGRFQNEFGRSVADSAQDGRNAGAGTRTLRGWGAGGRRAGAARLFQLVLVLATFALVRTVAFVVDFIAKQTEQGGHTGPVTGPSMEFDVRMRTFRIELKLIVGQLTVRILLLLLVRFTRR